MSSKTRWIIAVCAGVGVIAGDTGNYLLAIPFLLMGAIACAFGLYERADEFVLFGKKLK
ncbi:MAG: hypothetical protein HRT61_11725 [Ekhidna sp.]|nr:hypothetical protein [Ekhidna sp.]